jgi:DGQHR domain-containing protein
MSNPPNRSHVFYAVKVKQRDFVIYLSQIKGADLFRLCEPLRSPDSREKPIGNEKEQVVNDAKGFVEAISTSEFASEVSRIETESYGDDNPYQRFIDESRVTSIANYLKEEFALVPNSVVLAVGESVACDVKEKIHFARIKIDWVEGVPLSIIDGQHRVAGLESLLKNGPTVFDDFELPVCILTDVPFYLQAELFAVINGKQKPVSRSRIYDLLGYRPVSDPLLREKAYKGELAIHRFCHLAVRVLNNAKTSPWHERIKMRGAGPGVVTQAAMVDNLARLVTPKKNVSTVLTFPVLCKYFKKNDLIGLSRVCIIYFLGIAKARPDLWGDDKMLRDSLFGKTTGVAIMLTVMHDLCILEGGPDNITVEKVEQYWRKAPADRINTPPAGGSRGIQQQWYDAIMKQMVGPDYLLRLKASVDQIRPKLLEEGALYSKKMKVS